MNVETTDSMSDVGGANLLNNVCDTIKKYVAFADQHQPVAITLWIAANHALPAWHHATRGLRAAAGKEAATLRSMILQLQPVELDPAQLIDYLSGMIERYRYDTGIAAKFICDAGDLAQLGHRRKAVFRR